MRPSLPALLSAWMLALGQACPCSALQEFDISTEATRRVVIDREPACALEQPATALIGDGLAMICVYRRNRAGGEIVWKQSFTFGSLSGERLAMPETWKREKKSPFISKLSDQIGGDRLILWSATSTLELERSDESAVWKEWPAVSNWPDGARLAFVELLASEPGNYSAMLTDVENSALYQTKTSDGGRTWSQPKSIYTNAKADFSTAGFIRSPDGRQLAVLFRGKNETRSFATFSSDEGRIWSAPTLLPAALTGVDYSSAYAFDGRLFICFRDVAPPGQTGSDWVGWVGRYEELVGGREGQFRVRLMHDTQPARTGHPSINVIKDGTCIVTASGAWTGGEPPYIVSTSFMIEEFDARARITAPPTRLSQALQNRAENIAQNLHQFPVEAVLLDNWTEPFEGTRTIPRPVFESLRDFVNGDSDVEALAQLLDHPMGYVRALALSALFDREDPKLFPLIITQIGDPTPIARGLIFDQLNQGLVTESAPETVGAFAAKLVLASLNPDGTMTTPISISDAMRAWARANSQRDSATWLVWKLQRAAGTKDREPEPDRAGRIRKVREEVDQLSLSKMDRALALWTYSRRTGGSILVSEDDLISAFKALGTKGVLSLMEFNAFSRDPYYPPNSSSRLGIQDPGLLSKWLFNAVEKILPASALDEVLSRSHKLETPADLNFGLRDSWLAAAARLAPERASEFLKLDGAAASSVRAAELWRSRGMLERDAILKWFFDPALGRYAGAELNDGVDPRNIGTWFIESLYQAKRPDTPELIRAIASHASFPLLHRTTLASLRSLQREISGQLPEDLAQEHILLSNPNLCVVMARWRNDLRGTYGLPLEAVPQLPRSWITLVEPSKRLDFESSGDFHLISGLDDFFVLQSGAERDWRVRSVKSGNQIASYQSRPDRDLRGVAVSDSGNLAAFSYSGNFIDFVDFTSGKTRQIQLPEYADEYWDPELAISPNQYSILLRHSDGMNLHRYADGARLWSLPENAGYSLARFADGGRKIAASSGRNLILLFDAETGAESGRMDGHSGAIRTILSSANGQRLVSYAADGRINVWNPSEARLERTIHTYPANDEHSPVVLSRDGRRLAIADTHQSVFIYDLDAGAMLGEVRLREARLWTMAISADGSQLASICLDPGLLQVWQLDFARDK